MLDHVKTKSKKFYHDHKNVIDAFGAGFAIAAVLGLKHTSNVKEGLELKDCSLFTDADNRPVSLTVRRKNGRTDNYDWIASTPTD